ncbi:hypothetical protein SteCoe_22378 [Stentor coeruleus]|uniref:C2HC/C3H-type domain-containing protein n=1 Tax=Stentor coeruleus TaxID=5963 RepID=A0A1R2BM89_9CILI|nr:hypothetical protein SteCoe_22378 [Stentor coeruleus]
MDSQKKFSGRPRFEQCRYCGKEYGTTSLQLHEKTCMKTQETLMKQSLNDNYGRSTASKPIKSSSVPKPPTNSGQSIPTSGKYSTNPLTSFKPSQNSGQIFTSNPPGPSGTGQKPSPYPNKPPNPTSKNHIQNNPKNYSKPNQPIINPLDSRGYGTPTLEQSGKISSNHTLKKPSRGMQIAEYSNKPDDRVACRKCKRKFNPDRIAKHQSVCIGPINDMPVKPIPKVVKKRKTGLPLWKKQHLDFINNVRYAKKMAIVEKKGGDIRKIQAPVQHYDPTSDYKQCPYCSRKYSQQVAERHIPNCKNIINKPKPPPKAVNMKSGNRGGGFCPKCGGKGMIGMRKCGFCGG